MTIRPIKAAPGNAGFTLIELLVVMVLFGLISTALLGGLRFGTRAWDAGLQQSEAIGQIEVAQNLLRRQFAELLTRRRVEDENDHVPAFEGDSDQMAVASFYPSHVGLGGINYFEYRIVDTEEGLKRLELTWRPYPEDGKKTKDKPELAEERFLIDGIEEAEFRYYGVPQGDEKPRWTDKWEKEVFPPYLVALSIEFPAEDRRYWPELMVAPKAGGANQPIIEDE